jgi:hypothetical protein
MKTNSLSYSAHVCLGGLLGFILYLCFISFAGVSLASVIVLTQRQDLIISNLESMFLISRVIVLNVFLLPGLGIAYYSLHFILKYVDKLHEVDKE